MKHYKLAFFICVILIIMGEMSSGILFGQTIVSHIPANCALNVPRDGAISITFSNDIDINTVNDSTIRLWGSSSGLNSCSFSYTPETKTITLQPATLFFAGEKATVVVTNRVKNLLGGAFQKQVWNYTSAVSPSSGTFINTANYSVDPHPRTAVPADLNHDGLCDFAVSNWGRWAGRTISTFNNTGDAQFISTLDTIGNGPESVINADFNNDGKMDIAIANLGSDNIYVLFPSDTTPGRYITSQIIPIGQGARGVITNDFNGDGYPDLAVGNSHSASFTVMYNDGTGLFTRDSSFDVGAGCDALAYGDYDNDGDIDIVSSDGNNKSVSLTLNDGDGNFSTFISLELDGYPEGVVANDFDGDGSLDLAVTIPGRNEVYIAIHRGSTWFSKVQQVDVEVETRNVIEADVEGDGDLDLIVANWGTQGAGNTVTILTNDGSGNFIETSKEVASGGPVCTAVADYDNDGDLDFAIVNEDSSSVSILINQDLGQRYRTLISNSAYAEVPSKLIYKNGKLKTQPNLSSVIEALFTKLPKAGTTFLGVNLTANTTASRSHAWVQFKTSSQLKKLINLTHTGSSYPLDFIRQHGKPKKIAKAIVPDSKKYNNVALEQGVLLHLNILASKYGVLPPYFEDLLLNVPAILAGRQLQGASLKAIALYYDSVMTYWDELGINSSAAYSNLDDFAKNILKPINMGFNNTLSKTTFSVNAKDANKKNSYPVMLKGLVTPAEVGLVAIDPNKVFTSFQPPLETAPQKPTGYALMQNYPNPFNPTTTIQFRLIEDGILTLKVYNVLGQEVATLINNQQMETGTHDVTFDASNLSSGVYFYRLNINNGEFVQTKKLLLMK